MPINQKSSAVSLAIAHAEAWSNHNWEEAQKMLASDIQVTTTTTQPNLKPTNLAGIDAYMTGLIEFAQTIVPGSAHVIGSVGDEQNSLILLTVQATFGPDGPKVTIPAARLALFDENQKLKSEQVIFFVTPD